MKSLRARVRGVGISGAELPACMPGLSTTRRAFTEDFLAGVAWMASCGIHPALLSIWVIQDRANMSIVGGLKMCSGVRD